MFPTVDQPKPGCVVVDPIDPPLHIDPPPPEDAPLTRADVPRLLSESRAHALTRTRHGNKQQYPQAEQAAASALAARLQAHELDPTHTDPAWALDTAPHDQMVAFLRGYPDIP